MHLYSESLAVDLHPKPIQFHISDSNSTKQWLIQHIEWSTITKIEIDRTRPTVTSSKFRTYIVVIIPDTLNVEYDALLLIHLVYCEYSKRHAQREQLNISCK